MRVNVNAPLFAVWPPNPLLRETVRAEHLTVARLEPVFTRRLEGAFGLDAVFAFSDRIAVVPGIRVSHEMLVEPEKSALLWAVEIAQAVDEQTLAQIEKQLVPRLVAHTLGRQVNEEAIFWFSDALGKSEFESARSARFAGAAPYTDVALAVSPYAYAERFARDSRVAISDALGATGAAVLARVASGVRADLGDADLHALARRWFGREIFGAVTESADVGIGTAGTAVEIAFDEEKETIVRVATPVPTEVLISFDSQDSPVARTFSVQSKKRVDVRAARIAAPSGPSGGSSGKILLLLAADSLRDLHADADDARELGRRLSEEGFSVTIASTSQVPDAAQYDLLHAFGLTNAREFLPLFERARAAGIPIAATAGLAKNIAQAQWGSQIAQVVMSRYQDVQTRLAHLNLLALRRLGDAGADPAQAEPFAGFAEAVQAGLNFAGALVVSGAEEEAFVRSRFGYTGPVFHAAAYLNPIEPTPAIDEIAGSADFVLCHAPIHPVSNQGFLAAAARSSRLPLVLAGPVADSHYFGLLREELDGSAILWPNPGPDEVHALYRRARVFADGSWAQRSVHRAALAAAWGCAAVVPDGSYAASVLSGAVTCDVASPASVRTALEAAWAGSPAIFPGNTDAPFRATVQAYAQAQAERVYA